MPRIEIIPYQLRWLEEFQTLGSSLRSALGDAALAIHHIGSTGVPGLAAKDILDVQITVADLTDARLRPALEGLGLTWRDNVSNDHAPPGMTLEPAELEKRYAKAAAPARAAHVHIRAQGRFNQRYALLCRDYLRTHDGTRDAYAQVKLELARLFPDDVDAYYAVKDPAFDLFMSGAWEWARWTNWQPPATDA
jgi:GrpB-like predicted nucleotidyltransferase (UPF0157 family)